MLAKSSCTFVAILATAYSINIGGLGETETPLTDSTLAGNEHTSAPPSSSVLLVASQDTISISKSIHLDTATSARDAKSSGSSLGSSSSSGPISYNQYGFTGSQLGWEASSMRVGVLSTSHGSSAEPASRSTSSSASLHSKTSAASSVSGSRWMLLVISFALAITVGCALHLLQGSSGY